MQTSLDLRREKTLSKFDVDRIVISFDSEDVTRATYVIDGRLKELEAELKTNDKSNVITRSILALIKMYYDSYFVISQDGYERCLDALNKLRMGKASKYNIREHKFEMPKNVKVDTEEPKKEKPKEQTKDKSEKIKKQYDIDDILDEFFPIDLDLIFDFLGGRD